MRNLVNLSNLIHTSLDEWKVMNPLKKEILYIVEKIEFIKEICDGFQKRSTKK